ncbi:MAG: hypothetical protein NC191_10335, partial [Muribaculaceae bacterium]|nr:hypothetical protein [Muribaculaceae bacterium]
MSKPGFLNFKDNFDNILKQEWKLNFTSYGKDEYNQLISLFDTELNENGNTDGKLSNTEAQNLFKMAEEAAREMGDPKVLETEEADKLVQKLGINITGEELISFMAEMKGRVCWALSGGLTKPREPKDTVKVNKAEQIQPGNGISPEEKYTLKNLQKLYPKNKYDIQEKQCENDKAYIIIDKQTHKQVAEYYLRMDGTASVNLFNKNGEWTTSYAETSYGVISGQWIMQEDGEWDYKSYPNGNPETENIVNNLRQSGCGTNKIHNITQFISSIKSITPSNVIHTIDTFGGGSGDNRTLLFDWIAACDTLSPESKKSAITYIIKQLLTEAKQKGIYINDLEVKLNSEIYSQLDSCDWQDAQYIGLFAQQLMNRIESGAPTPLRNQPNGIVADSDFNQGHTGDCWLLASIKGIANTPKGREILNNSVKVNTDGSVDVTLKGVGKTYHITRAELYGNTQLSNGDGDVRALEIAVEKFFEEERGSERTGGRLDIDGNWEHNAMRILTGADAGAKGVPLAESAIPEFIKENKFMQRLLYTTNDKGEKITLQEAVLQSFNKENVVSCVSAHGDKQKITCKATPSGTGELIT